VGCAAFLALATASKAQTGQDLLTLCISKNVKASRATLSPNRV
jgi:hypothetical protein